MMRVPAIVALIVLFSVETSRSMVGFSAPAIRRLSLRLSMSGGGDGSNANSTQAAQLPFLNPINFDIHPKMHSSMGYAGVEKLGGRSSSSHGSSRDRFGGRRMNTTEMFEEHKRVLKDCARKQREKLWNDHRRAEHSRSRSAPAPRAPLPAEQGSAGGSGGWHLNNSVGQKIWTTQADQMPWGNMSRGLSPGVSWESVSASAVQKVRSEEWFLRGGGERADDTQDDALDRREHDFAAQQGHHATEIGMGRKSRRRAGFSNL
jgi:hypothetical protein